MLRGNKPEDWQWLIKMIAKQRETEMKDKTPARMRDVVLRHVYPPIPIRSYDWCAWHDGHEEGNTGWGPTPEAALADLAQLDEDRADEDEMLRDAGNSSDLKYRMWRSNQRKD